MSQVLTSYLNRPKIYTPDDAAFYAQYGDWPKDASAYLMSSLAFDEYEANSLGAAISDTSSTTITVSSAIALSAPFYLRVDSETMLCAAKDGTTLTVTRGAGTTTAATHSSGATVYAYKLTDAKGHTWTPSGAVYVADGLLNLAGGYIYTPCSDKLVFGDAYDWQFADAFEFAFDFYPNSASRAALFAMSVDCRIGMDFDYNGTRNVNIWLSSGSGWSPLNADSGGTGIGSASLTLNAKNIIVWRKSGTNHKTVINGATDINVTAAGAPYFTSTENFRIGIWGNNGLALTGKIGNFKVYNGGTTA